MASNGDAECVRACLFICNATEARPMPEHMWVGGCPNPNKIEQYLKSTFLNLYAHVKTK